MCIHCWRACYVQTFAVRVPLNLRGWEKKDKGSQKPQSSSPSSLIVEILLNENSLFGLQA